VVFRDGRSIGSGLLAETGQDEIVRMMVGRSVEHVFPKVDVAIGSTVLKVSGYSHPTEFDNISFELRRGEILGLYGLVGAGRSELCQALFGITHASAGNVALEGRPIVIRSPVDAISAGAMPRGSTFAPRRSQSPSARCRAETSRRW
jgi:rhamnose transport system ATP-binding protein